MKTNFFTWKSKKKEWTYIWFFEPYFKWYDIWIGMYISDQCVYIGFFPMVGLRIGYIKSY